MCFGSRVVRKGERVSGARLNGAGGSRLVVESGFEVGFVVLKARALGVPFGGILLSLWLCCWDSWKLGFDTRKRVGHSEYLGHRRESFKKFGNPQTMNSPFAIH